MEKERTIHNLLEEEVYRITKEQIDQLIQIILDEIRKKTFKGISGIISYNQELKINSKYHEKEFKKNDTEENDSEYPYKQTPEDF